eukprot:CAMPEP_0114262862 /NCGR_PEP_ID=MMETSP0058-20121206/22090_1 /TAXON_ID=36894 /ORGANISM="Pyramimonas parkeae, CCMP726" /LENGTH=155 /DNA_ID=CAMNT_0001378879 /DNA_START=46 /DNA_END=510 /DNA_ORIENTATION=+
MSTGSDFLDRRVLASLSSAKSKPKPKSSGAAGSLHARHRSAPSTTAGTDPSDALEIEHGTGPSVPAVAQTRADPKPKSNDRLAPWQAYIHVVKGNVGPGCLSMPYTFSEGGIIPSCLILIVFAPACIYCMNLLVAAKHKILATRTGVDPHTLNFE